MPKTISVPTRCTLCPRRCGADRAAGRTGFCGAGATLKAARAALHHWEEPCISGTRGSGTVFFSGCTLKCCFCQNYPISAEGLGKEITVEHLAEIFLNLQAQGAHNINLVTPGQWQPWIIAALDIARTKGLRLPIVCNTGGYETVESVEAWRGYIDILTADWDKVLTTSWGLDWGEVETAAEETPQELSEKYTLKITTPIYEVKGDKPDISELVDVVKTNAIIDEINAADGIPEDVKGFLRIAAARLYRFNYEKIAEYYAHQPPEIQAIMEKLALVIIDFNKAIENGYVRLTKEIEGLLDDESDE